MKRLVSVSLLCALFLVTCLLPTGIAQAAGQPPVLFLNGNVVIGSAPVIVNDTTLVPFRAVAELTGVSVSWDNDRRVASASFGTTTIALPIDKPTAFVNGQATTLPVPASLIGGRSFVPLRFIAETFGMVVQWNDHYHFIFLETPDKKGSSQVIVDAMQSLGIDDLSVRDGLGKGFVDVKTGERLWLVTLEKDTTFSYGAKLVFRKGNGQTVAVRYSGMMLFDDLKLITAEEFDSWAALKGHFVWAWKAPSTRWPASVKNLECVTVTDVQVTGDWLYPVKVTFSTDSGPVSITIPSKDVHIDPWYTLDWQAHYVFTEAPRPQHPGWTEEVWQAIADEQVFVGMTSDQVHWAWGLYDRKNETTTGYGTYEQWVYGNGQYLYFHNDVLTTIQEL